MNVPVSYAVSDPGVRAVAIVFTVSRVSSWPAVFLAWLHHEAQKAFTKHGQSGAVEGDRRPLVTTTHGISAASRHYYESWSTTNLRVWSQGFVADDLI